MFSYAIISVDKPEVKKIGEQLIKHGLRPWLDEWELRPDFPWQRLLERVIEKIVAEAVFVGPSGIGPWQLEAYWRGRDKILSKNARSATLDRARQ